MNDLHNVFRSINLNGETFSFPASLELKGARESKSGREQGTRITQSCGFLAHTSLCVCVRALARLRLVTWFTLILPKPRTTL